MHFRTWVHFKISQISINKKRFLTGKHTQEEILSHKKGLKRFSLMIIDDHRFSQATMNKKRFSQIKISTPKKILHRVVERGRLQ